MSSGTCATGASMAISKGKHLPVHCNVTSWTLHAMWYGMQGRQEKAHQSEPLVLLHSSKSLS